jgi:hypothetical protein
VELVDKHPANSNHPGCANMLRGRPLSADPALENVEIKLAVDDLVDSIYDFFKNVWLHLTEISDVLRFYLEFFFGDNLALTEPIEAVLKLLNNFGQMDIFDIFNYDFAFFAIPLHSNIVVVFHLVFYA